MQGVTFTYFLLDPFSGLHTIYCCGQVVGNKTPDYLYHNIVVYCKAVPSNLYLINFIGGREDHIHHSDVIYTTAGVIQSTAL